MRLSARVGGSSSGRADRALSSRTVRVHATKKVIVVGGGWAGFGAAKHLAQQPGIEVTLLDAQPDPGGLSTGFRTKDGKAVEAGMKGFWYSYANLFKLLEEDLGLKRGTDSWPLTDWTTSGFWSPRGLVTEAPVFSKLPRLPTLIGQFVHTAPLHWSVSLADRLTMLPFLLAFLDYTSNEETFLKYDKLSAYELFARAGVSKEAFTEFLRPTLLVGLFAPPEQISAAVMLETLYYYALAHQSDFDVCWCKGSIAELIFSPLVQRMRDQGAVVQGSRAVTGLVMGEGAEADTIKAVQAKDLTTGAALTYEADAVVLAVGITAMQRLVQSNPALGSRAEFQAFMDLRAIDVLATRLFFDKRVPTRYPANVLSGFEATAGATFFNLNDLQDEYKDAPGSVITADFYGSNQLMPLSDEQVVRRVHQHLSTCEPGFRGAKVVDSVVLRFPKAVTHFSPGSYPSRPTQSTSISNAFIAADYVKGLKHGANGLSQERAYVAGLAAANLVVDRLGVGSPAHIIPVEPDEPHIAAGREAVRALRGLPGLLGLQNPLLI